MKLNNFEKEIDRIILDRGIDYYESGYVTDIQELKNDEWSAIVEGTVRYRVKVKFSKGRIVSSECSCPYDMGPVCKHEVAVYYAIREEVQGDGDKAVKRETGEMRLKSILGRLDKEELTTVIIEHALENNKFYHYLMVGYGVPEKGEGKTGYKKYLKSCIDTAMGRDEYIDYYNTPGVAEDALQLIADADRALGKKQYENAVYMAQAVIEEMVRILEYTDDSDGEINMVIDDAFKILDKAFKCALPEKIRKELFLYCMAESRKCIYNEYGSYQDDFIVLALNASSSEKEMDIILGAIENNIKIEAGKSNSSFRIEELYMMKYDILKRMKRSEEAGQFFVENLKFPGFRRMAIEEAFRKKDYERVIELAADGEKKDRADNYSGLIREWKEWRYKACSAKKDYPAIHELAREFLVKHHDISYYDIYKKTTGAGSWHDTYEKLRAELLKKAGNSFPGLLANIFVKEGELPALLDMLKKHPENVTSYQKHFLKTHAEDIYKLHVLNIRNEAKLANDRTRYRYVCDSIKGLKRIGGKVEAVKLINEFKELYKKRPAFMDELGRI